MNDARTLALPARNLLAALMIMVWWSIVWKRFSIKQPCWHVLALSCYSIIIRVELKHAILIHYCSSCGTQTTYLHEQYIAVKTQQHPLKTQPIELERVTVGPGANRQHVWRWRWV